MGIRFHLSAKQAQLLHAVLVGGATATVSYVADAVGRLALGGPRVVFSSLLFGALIAGAAKGLGVWVRGATSAP